MVHATLNVPSVAYGGATKEDCSLPSQLGGQALQVPFPEIQSSDGTSGGNLEPVVRMLRPAFVRGQ